MIYISERKELIVMDAIMEVFSSLLGDVDLTEIMEMLTPIIEYLTSLISSLLG